MATQVNSLSAGAVPDDNDPWFQSSGGCAAAFPFVDWRVQLFIAASIVGFSIYAIVAMPQINAKFAKMVDAL